MGSKTTLRTSSCAGRVSPAKRRPKKESFCELDIVENYQQGRNRRAKRGASDVDLTKKISELSARNAQIEEIYGNKEISSSSGDSKDKSEFSKSSRRSSSAKSSRGSSGESRAGRNRRQHASLDGCWRDGGKIEPEEKSKQLEGFHTLVNKPYDHLNPEERKHFKDARTKNHNDYINQEERKHFKDLHTKKHVDNIDQEKMNHSQAITINHNNIQEESKHFKDLHAMKYDDDIIKEERKQFKNSHTMKHNDNNEPEESKCSKDFHGVKHVDNINKKEREYLNAMKHNDNIYKEESKRFKDLHAKKNNNKEEIKRFEDSNIDDFNPEKRERFKDSNARKPTDPEERDSGSKARKHTDQFLPEETKHLDDFNAIAKKHIKDLNSEARKHSGNFHSKEIKHFEDRDLEEMKRIEDLKRQQGKYFENLITGSEDLNAKDKEYFNNRNSRERKRYEEFKLQRRKQFEDLKLDEKEDFNVKHGGKDFAKYNSKRGDFNSEERRRFEKSPCVEGKRFERNPFEEKARFEKNPSEERKICKQDTKRFRGCNLKENKRFEDRDLENVKRCSEDFNVQDKTQFEEFNTEERRNFEGRSSEQRKCCEDFKRRGRNQSEDIKSEGRNQFEDFKPKGRKQFEDFKPKERNQSEDLKPEGKNQFEDFKSEERKQFEDFKSKGRKQSEDFKPKGRNQSEDLKSEGRIQSEDLRSEGRTQFEDFKHKGRNQSEDLKSEGRNQIEDFKSEGRKQFEDHKLEERKYIEERHNNEQLNMKKKEDSNSKESKGCLGLDREERNRFEEIKRKTRAIKKRKNKSRENIQSKTPDINKIGSFEEQIHKNGPGRQTKKQSTDVITVYENANAYADFSESMTSKDLGKMLLNKRRDSSESKMKKSVKEYEEYLKNVVVSNKNAIVENDDARKRLLQNPMRFVEENRKILNGTKDVAGLDKTKKPVVTEKGFNLQNPSDLISDDLNKNNSFVKHDGQNNQTTSKRKNKHRRRHNSKSSDNQTSKTSEEDRLKQNEETKLNSGIRGFSSVSNKPEAIQAESNKKIDSKKKKHVAGEESKDGFMIFEKYLRRKDREETAEQLKEKGRNQEEFQTLRKERFGEEDEEGRKGFRRLSEEGRKEFRRMSEEGRKEFRRLSEEREDVEDKSTIKRDEVAWCRENNREERIKCNYMEYESALPKKDTEDQGRRDFKDYIQSLTKSCKIERLKKDRYGFFGRRKKREADEESSKNGDRIIKKNWGFNNSAKGLSFGQKREDNFLRRDEISFRLEETNGYKRMDDREFREETFSNDVFEDRDAIRKVCEEDRTTLKEDLLIDHRRFETYKEDGYESKKKVDNKSRELEETRTNKKDRRWSKEEVESNNKLYNNKELQDFRNEEDMAGKNVTENEDNVTENKVSLKYDRSSSKEEVNQERRSCKKGLDVRRRRKKSKDSKKNEEYLRKKYGKTENSKNKYGRTENEGYSRKNYGGAGNEEYPRKNYGDAESEEMIGFNKDFKELQIGMKAIEILDKKKLDDANKLTSTSAKKEVGGVYLGNSQHLGSDKLDYTTISTPSTNSDSKDVSSLNLTNSEKLKPPTTATTESSRSVTLKKNVIEVTADESLRKLLELYRKERDDHRIGIYNRKEFRTTINVLRSPKTKSIHRKELGFSNLNLNLGLRKSLADTSLVKASSKTALALRDICKVAELEKVGKKFSRRKKNCGLLSPKRGISQNNRFHRCRNSAINDRIVEISSKMLKDGEVKFTVEGVEPAKKLLRFEAKPDPAEIKVQKFLEQAGVLNRNEESRVFEDFNKTNKSEDVLNNLKQRIASLKIQTFKGIDMNLSDITLLSHGVRRNEKAVSRSSINFDAPSAMTFPLIGNVSNISSPRGKRSFNLLGIKREMKKKAKKLEVYHNEACFVKNQVIPLKSSVIDSTTQTSSRVEANNHGFKILKTDGFGISPEGIDFIKGLFPSDIFNKRRDDAIEENRSSEEITLRDSNSERSRLKEGSFMDDPRNVAENINKQSSESVLHNDHKNRRGKSSSSVRRRSSSSAEIILHRRKASFKKDKPLEMLEIDRKKEIESGRERLLSKRSRSINSRSINNGLLLRDRSSSAREENSSFRNNERRSDSKSKFEQNREDSKRKSMRREDLKKKQQQESSKRDVDFKRSKSMFAPVERDVSNLMVEKTSKSEDCIQNDENSKCDPLKTSRSLIDVNGLKIRVGRRNQSVEKKNQENQERKGDKDNSVGNNKEYKKDHHSNFSSRKLDHNEDKRKLYHNVDTRKFNHNGDKQKMDHNVDTRNLDRNVDKQKMGHDEHKQKSDHNMDKIKENLISSKSVLNKERTAANRRECSLSPCGTRRRKEMKNELASSALIRKNQNVGASPLSSTTGEDSRREKRSPTGRRRRAFSSTMNTNEVDVKRKERRCSLSPRGTRPKNGKKHHSSEANPVEEDKWKRNVDIESRLIEEERKGFPKRKSKRTEECSPKFSTNHGIVEREERVKSHECRRSEVEQNGLAKNRKSKTTGEDSNRYSRRTEEDFNPKIDENCFIKRNRNREETKNLSRRSPNRESQLAENQRKLHSSTREEENVTSKRVQDETNSCKDSIRVENRRNSYGESELFEKKRNSNREPELLENEKNSCRESELYKNKRESFEVSKKSNLKYEDQEFKQIEDRKSSSPRRNPFEEPAEKNMIVLNGYDASKNQRSTVRRKTTSRRMKNELSRRRSSSSELSRNAESRENVVLNEFERIYSKQREQCEETAKKTESGIFSCHRNEIKALEKCLNDILQKLSKDDNNNCNSREVKKIIQKANFAGNKKIEDFHGCKVKKIIQKTDFANKIEDFQGVNFSEDVLKMNDLVEAYTRRRNEDKYINTNKDGLRRSLSIEENESSGQSLPNSEELRKHSRRTQRNFDNRRNGTIGKSKFGSSSFIRKRFNKSRIGEYTFVVNKKMCKTKEPALFFNKMLLKRMPRESSSSTRRRSLSSLSLNISDFKDSSSSVQQFNEFSIANEKRVSSLARRKQQRRKIEKPLLLVAKGSSGGRNKRACRSRMKPCGKCKIKKFEEFHRRNVSSLEDFSSEQNITWYESPESLRRFREEQKMRGLIGCKERRNVGLVNDEEEYKRGVGFEERLKQENAWKQNATKRGFGCKERGNAYEEEYKRGGDFETYLKEENACKQKVAMRGLIGCKERRNADLINDEEEYKRWGDFEERLKQDNTRKQNITMKGLIGCKERRNADFVNDEEEYKRRVDYDERLKQENAWKQNVTNVLAVKAGIDKKLLNSKGRNETTFVNRDGSSSSNEDIEDDSIETLKANKDSSIVEIYRKTPNTIPNDRKIGELNELLKKTGRNCEEMKKQYVEVHTKSNAPDKFVANQDITTQMKKDMFVDTENELLKKSMNYEEYDKRSPMLNKRNFKTTNNTPVSNIGFSFTNNFEAGMKKNEKQRNILLEEMMEKKGQQEETSRPKCVEMNIPYKQIPDEIFEENSLFSAKEEIPIEEQVPGKHLQFSSDEETSNEVKHYYLSSKVEISLEEDKPAGKIRKETPLERRLRLEALFDSGEEVSSEDKARFTSKEDLSIGDESRESRLSLSGRIRRKFFTRKKSNLKSQVKSRDDREYIFKFGGLKMRRRARGKCEDDFGRNEERKDLNYEDARLLNNVESIDRKDHFKEARRKGSQEEMQCRKNNFKEASEEEMQRRNDSKEMKNRERDGRYKIDGFKGMDPKKGGSRKKGTSEEMRRNDDIRKDGAEEMPAIDNLFVKKRTINPNEVKDIGARRKEATREFKTNEDLGELESIGLRRKGITREFGGNEDLDGLELKGVRRKGITREFEANEDLDGLELKGMRRKGITREFEANEDLDGLELKGVRRKGITREFETNEDLGGLELKGVRRKGTTREVKANKTLGELEINVLSAEMHPVKQYGNDKNPMEIRRKNREESRMCNRREETCNNFEHDNNFCLHRRNLANDQELLNRMKKSLTQNNLKRCPKKKSKQTLSKSKEDLKMKPKEKPSSAKQNLGKINKENSPFKAKLRCEEENRKRSLVNMKNALKKGSLSMESLTSAVVLSQTRAFSKCSVEKGEIGEDSSRKCLIAKNPFFMEKEETGSVDSLEKTVFDGNLRPLTAVFNFSPPLYAYHVYNSFTIYQKRFKKRGEDVSDEETAAQRGNGNVVQINTNVNEITVSGDNEDGIVSNEGSSNIQKTLAPDSSLKIADFNEASLHKFKDSSKLESFRDEANNSTNLQENLLFRRSSDGTPKVEIDETLNMQSGILKKIEDDLNEAEAILNEISSTKIASSGKTQESAKSETATRKSRADVKQDISIKQDSAIQALNFGREIVSDVIYAVDENQKVKLLKTLDELKRKFSETPRFAEDDSRSTELKGLTCQVSNNCNELGIISSFDSKMGMLKTKEAPEVGRISTKMFTVGFKSKTASKEGVLETNEVSKMGKLEANEVSKEGKLDANEVSKMGMFEIEEVSKMGMFQTNEVSTKGMLQTNEVSKKGLLVTNEVSKEGMLQTNEVSKEGKLQTNDVSKKGFLVTNEVSKKGMLQTNEVSKKGFLVTNEVSKEGMLQTNDVSKKGFLVTNEVSKEGMLQTNEVSKEGIFETNEVSKKKMLRANEVSKKGMLQTNDVSKMEIFRKNEVSKKGMLETKEVSEMEKLETNEISKMETPETNEVSKVGIPEMKTGIPPTIAESKADVFEANKASKHKTVNDAEMLETRKVSKKGTLESTPQEIGKRVTDEASKSKKFEENQTSEMGLFVTSKIETFERSRVLKGESPVDKEDLLENKESPVIKTKKCIFKTPVFTKFQKNKTLNMESEENELENKQSAKVVPIGPNETPRDESVKRINETAEKCLTDLSIEIKDVHEKEVCVNKIESFVAPIRNEVNEALAVQTSFSEIDNGIAVEENKEKRIEERVFQGNEAPFIRRIEEQNNRKSWINEDSCSDCSETFKTWRNCSKEASPIPINWISKINEVDGTPSLSKNASSACMYLEDSLDTETASVDSDNCKAKRYSRMLNKTSNVSEVMRTQVVGERDCIEEYSNKESVVIEEYSNKEIVVIGNETPIVDHPFDDALNTRGFVETGAISLNIQSEDVSSYKARCLDYSPVEDATNLNDDYTKPCSMSESENSVSAYKNFFGKKILGVSYMPKSYTTWAEQSRETDDSAPELSLLRPKYTKSPILLTGRFLKRKKHKLTKLSEIGEKTGSESIKFRYTRKACTETRPSSETPSVCELSSSSTRDVFTSNESGYETSMVNSSNSIRSFFRKGGSLLDVFKKSKRIKGRVIEEDERDAGKVKTLESESFDVSKAFESLDEGDETVESSFNVKEVSEIGTSGSSFNSKSGDVRSSGPSFESKRDVRSSSSSFDPKRSPYDSKRGDLRSSYFDSKKGDVRSSGHSHDSKRSDERSSSPSYDSKRGRYSGSSFDSKREDVRSSGLSFDSKRSEVRSSGPSFDSRRGDGKSSGSSFDSRRVDERSASPSYDSKRDVRSSGSSFDPKRDVRSSGPCFDSKRSNIRPSGSPSDVRSSDASCDAKRGDLRSSGLSFDSKRDARSLNSNNLRSSNRVDPRTSDSSTDLQIENKEGVNSSVGSKMENRDDDTSSFDITGNTKTSDSPNASKKKEREENRSSLSSDSKDARSSAPSFDSKMEARPIRTPGFSFDTRNGRNSDRNDLKMERRERGSPERRITSSGFSKRYSGLPFDSTKKETESSDPPMDSRMFEDFHRENIATRKYRRSRLLEGSPEECFKGIELDYSVYEEKKSKKNKRAGFVVNYPNEYGKDSQSAIEEDDLSGIEEDIHREVGDIHLKSRNLLRQFLRKKKTSEKDFENTQSKSVMWFNFAKKKKQQEMDYTQTCNEKPKEKYCKATSTCKLSGKCRCGENDIYADDDLSKKIMILRQKLYEAIKRNRYVMDRSKRREEEDKIGILREKLNAALKKQSENSRCCRQVPSREELPSVSTKTPNKPHKGSHKETTQTKKFCKECSKQPKPEVVEETPANVFEEPEEEEDFIDYERRFKYMDPGNLSTVSLISEQTHSSVESQLSIQTRQLTDKEVFDRLLTDFERKSSIAEKLSRNTEFFNESLKEASSLIVLEERSLDELSTTDLKPNIDVNKYRGPKFTDKDPSAQKKIDCSVDAEDIGTCFARGFRPDHLMLSGEACFNLNKQDKLRMSPYMLKSTESIIDFSERETPLDFLLALGFMVDEASNALKDDDIRSRLLAAITEARVWINKISTTQGTLLYLVAFKARPETMRYFLQLVEAIINKRISNAITLDGFLRVLEQVEDGRIQMISILGEDKFDDAENEEKAVKRQLKQLFVNVYSIAEKEALNAKKELQPAQVNLLRILVSKYRAGLLPHVELIARYIGQGLLDRNVQLEAAMIYLSRLDTADVKLKEFENYCGIRCEKK